MTQQEYIRQLKELLQPLSEQERADILADIAEHFDAGKADGKTEEQICRDLGLPVEYAAQFLPPISYHAASGKEVGKKIGYGISTFFFALVFIGLFGAAASMALVGIPIFVMSLFVYPDFWTLLGSFFYSLLMSSLGVAAFCGTFLLWQVLPVYGKVSERPRKGFRQVALHSLITSAGGLAVLVLVTVLAGAAGNSLFHTIDDVKQEALTLSENALVEINSVPGVEILPAGEEGPRAQLRTEGSYFLFYPTYQLEAAQEGSLTKVTTRLKNYLMPVIGGGSARLRIYLPESAIDTLDLRTVSGDSVMTGRGNIRTMTVTSTSGNVILERSSFDKLQVRNVSGNVTARDLTSRDTKFSMTSGNVRMDGAYTDLKLQVVSGNVTLDGSAENIEGDFISGNAILNMVSAPQSLDLDMTSGNVKLSLPADSSFAVLFRAVSGDFHSDLPFSTKKEDRDTLYQIGQPTGVPPYTVNCVSGNLSVYQK